MRWLLFFLACSTFSGCSHLSRSPYELADEGTRGKFKQVRLPLPDGTAFHLSQGAFGAYTHHDPGQEYKWDLDVPYGTPVVSVEEGTVFQVWQPELAGGCDPRFQESPNNLKVMHRDGTVAQYTHIRTWLSVGQKVKRGDVIAVTANNGFHCAPQLCFSIFSSKDHLYGTASPRTIPLRFQGVPGELLHSGTDYTVPPEGIRVDRRPAQALPPR